MRPEAGVVGTVGEAADPPNREIELKLRIDPPAAAKLRRSSVVAARKIGRARTRNLVSTYFDTGDRGLERNGLTLRVRRVGARRVQTLKGMTGGLAGRPEWETDVEGDTPDLSRFGGASGVPEGIDGPDALQPIFTTAVRRTAWLLRADDGSAVELALDQGELRADGLLRPICEAELELKSGSAAALFDLAHDLIAEVPFRLDPHAKSDRGFALAARREGQSVRARPAALAPAMSVETAFKLIADGCLRHAALNEECALLGRDPEGVHQMRVALRRLRSAFGLFREVLPADAGPPLSEELRWIAGELGQARDWDVFVSAVLAPLRAQIADDPSLERLAALAEDCRKAGYQRAREAVLSRRYTEAKLGLAGWLVSPWDRHSRIATGPIAPFADAVLEKRACKLLKAGRDHAAMPPEELHRLRILAKRVRYAAEFFGGLYRLKAAKKYIQSLARVQDVLGVLNDSNVGMHLLEQAAERAGPAAEEPWFARASALVNGWYASQTDRELQHLSAAWDTLADQRRFWSKPPAEQSKPRAA